MSNSLRSMLCVALAVAVASLAAHAPGVGGEPPLCPSVDEQCGAACALFLLHYFNAPVPASEVTGALPADPTDNRSGASLLDLKEVLGRQGLFAVGVQDIALADLTRAVDGKVTALAVLCGCAGSHFRVFVKADAGRLLVADVPNSCAWSEIEGRIREQFECEGPGGKCLLVSYEPGALRQALTSLGIEPPTELQGAPRLALEATELRFTPSDVQDGHVALSLAFRNAGELPLVVRSARSACGCTSVAHLDRWLEPGATGRVDLTIVCEAWGDGEGSRLLYLATNDPENRVAEVVISGACTSALQAQPQAASVVSWYPHELSFGMLADAGQWDPEAHAILVQWPVELGLSVQRATCDVPGATVQTAVAPATRDGLQAARVTVDLRACGEGALDGELTVVLAGAELPAVAVPVRGTILPPFVAAPPRLLLVLAPAQSAVQGTVAVRSPRGEAVHLVVCGTRISQGRLDGAAVTIGGRAILTVTAYLPPGVSDADGEVSVLAQGTGDARPLTVPVRCVRLRPDAER